MVCVTHAPLQDIFLVLQVFGVQGQLPPQRNKTVTLCILMQKGTMNLSGNSVPEYPQTSKKV